MLSKIKIQKIELSLILLVVLQILLLSNMPVAQSYSFYQSDPLMDNAKQLEEKRINDKIRLGINLLIGFLSIKQIGVVSAETVQTCCINSNNGAICQEGLSSDSPNESHSCEEPHLCGPGVVDCCNLEVEECQMGCCFDSEQGTCAENSPKSKCESEGGTWTNDADCRGEDNQNCQIACCELYDGIHSQLTSKKMCEILSSSFNYPTDWEQGVNYELECLARAISQDEGACIFEDGTCRFLTEKVCDNGQGTFYAGYLCSNPKLGTECTPQVSISCVEGKDEIYWFDSCGNRENIFDSNKDASWNEGYVLGKENSCGPVDGSRSSSTTCGDCDRAAGSQCVSSVEFNGKAVAGGEYGDFICGNFNCLNAPGNGEVKDRKNGEKWCVFDSNVGKVKSPYGNDFSSDTVGSEHWIYSCDKGEVKSERCGNYRSELCQEVIDENKRSFAWCVINQDSICMSYNEKNEMDKCRENTYCYVKHVNVDKDFKFNMCVPRHPIGSGLKTESPGLFCSLANQVCTTIEEKKITDGKIKWVWKANRDCASGDFSKEMSDLCISLGDCGNYLNYLGEGSQNSQISEKSKTSKRAPKPVPWTDYKRMGFYNPKRGQILDLQTTFPGGGKVDTDPEVARKLYAWRIGLTGALVGIIGSLGGMWAISAIGGAVAPTIGAVNFAYYGVYGMYYGAIGFGIGMVAALLIGSMLGIQGQGIIIFSIAGGVAGATISIMAFAPYGGVTPLGVGILVAALVIMALVKIIGIGDFRERKIKHTCLPWQAPLGIQNCRACNEDPLKPCTRYRCEALGQACILLNEGKVENPECILEDNDGAPPIIKPSLPVGTPWTIKPGLDLQFTSEGVTSSNGIKIESSRDDECIPEFTMIDFTLQSFKQGGTETEYAQCKYSYSEPLENYDEMEPNYPGGSNIFRVNHTFVLFMPSVESLEGSGIEGDFSSIYKNMKIYVKCIDAYANSNQDNFVVEFCVNSDPDKTPVDHSLTAADPENGTILGFNQTEVDATIYINEPAECRYSLVPEVSYDNMTEEFDCNTDPQYGRELQGWPCSATLNLESENNFYIKCRDKPWEEDNDLRNTNEDDFVYTLYTSDSPLTIDSVSPQGELSFGFEPFTLELEVETSGGSNHGTATCFWGEDENNLVPFHITNTATHKQTLQNQLPRSYQFYIRCEDTAGNIAESTISFGVRGDGIPPKVARIYFSGSSLFLMTDEDAECYYSTNGCNFIIENATSMTQGLSKEHNADWTIGKLYYVKCSDVWGNVNPDCAIDALTVPEYKQLDIPIPVTQSTNNSSETNETI